jgi:hypothetical protein
MALAAKVLGTHLDLEKNEVRQAVVQNLSSAPGSPSTGQVYFDTTTHKLRFYDGTAWQDATGGSLSASSIETFASAFIASKLL